MSTSHILKPLPVDQPGGQVWPSLPILVSSITFPPVSGATSPGQTPVSSNWTEAITLTSVVQPWAAPKTTTARINKMNNVITMTVVGIVADTATANQPIILDGIPTWARSVNNNYGFTRVVNNSAVVGGMFLVGNASSQMIIYANQSDASFTAAGTAGFSTFSVTYMQGI